jgi:uridine kinase
LTQRPLEGHDVKTAAGGHMMPRLVTNKGTLVSMITQAAQQKGLPFLVGIDGRSGVGKSTLAKAVTEEQDMLVIEGDDFYAGGTELRTDSPESRAAACIDWTRQRTVLEAVKAGRAAWWRAFDWDAFDGPLCDEPTRVEPRPIVILEGVYAARPELADLLDLRVAVVAPDELRLVRLAEREGVIGPWERQWHEAEEFYFQAVMPMGKFDVVVKDLGL